MTGKEIIDEIYKYFKKSALSFSGTFIIDPKTEPLLFQIISYDTGRIIAKKWTITNGKAKIAAKDSVWKNKPCPNISNVSKITLYCNYNKIRVLFKNENSEKNDIYYMNIGEFSKECATYKRNVEDNYRKYLEKRAEELEKKTNEILIELGRIYDELDKLKEDS